MADGVFFWSKLLTVRNIQYEYYGVSLDYFDLITFVNLQSHLLVDLKEKFYLHHVIIIILFIKGSKSCCFMSY